MTGSAFKTMVASHFNRSDLTNVIATMAAMAVVKLEREKFWFQLASTTIAVTAGSSAISYPSDFVDEVQDGYKDSDGNPLTKEDWAQVDHWQKYSGDTASKPAYYALGASIHPYPMGADTQTMQYYKSLGFPADTSSNAWTTTVYDLTFWMTIEQVWHYLRNTEEETKAKANRLIALADARSLSGRLTGIGRVEYQEF